MNTSREWYVVRVLGLVLAVLVACTCAATAAAQSTVYLPYVMCPAKQILYSCSSVAGRGYIINDAYVVDGDGSHDTHLALGEDPDWSPDGVKIAYAAWTGGVWVMNRDGSGATQISGHGQKPDWSPDGSRIVFQGGNWVCTGWHCAWLNGYVYVMNADGGNQVQLTSYVVPTHRIYADIAWSPDGSMIAFDAEGVDVEPGPIFLMNADGSNQRELTYSGSGFRWSPDSTQVAFTRGVYVEGFGLTYEVRAVDADGSNDRRLASGSGPVWLPDGGKIAFTEADTLYVINVDGSEQTPLASGAAYTSPAWSTDGVRIAFTKGEGHIWVMDANGANQIRLTDREEFCHSPAWRP